MRKSQLVAGVIILAILVGLVGLFIISGKKKPKNDISVTDQALSELQRPTDIEEIGEPVVEKQPTVTPASEVSPTEKPVSLHMEELTEEQTISLVKDGFSTWFAWTWYPTEDLSIPNKASDSIKEYCSTDFYNEMSRITKQVSEYTASSNQPIDSDNWEYMKNEEGKLWDEVEPGDYWLVYDQYEEMYVKFGSNPEHLRWEFPDEDTYAIIEQVKYRDVTLEDIAFDFYEFEDREGWGFTVTENVHGYVYEYELLFDDQNLLDGYRYFM